MDTNQLIQSTQLMIPVLEIIMKNDIIEMEEEIEKSFRLAEQK